ncbi:uncharacterized protein LOC107267260 [Cephus cinctus]|uniref:Uncharacterized protein LOC107267260 n=1 Tax=Cephus cinctus TaxID=211228 RepID=A0AAJ7BTX7_CEPCN|nr:uncharacterized protein LOC107267260 [Cephus cinctus]
MGDLPAPRVNVSRPFSHVGVDFCGPFLVKRMKQGQHCQKVWVAIFICLAVKAIHLEYAGDLSTPTFLAALRRFFARRGVCTYIYSDKGTNFVGAEKILSKLLDQPAIHQEFTRQRITWHFMPPAAPHFGGLWEAGVKSFKRHFYRVVGQAKLTIEEFITICAQIEVCLNSRPLCPLSDSPEDATALTPGHFLIGDALLSPPTPSMKDLHLKPTTRWQYQQ